MGTFLYRILRMVIKARRIELTGVGDSMTPDSELAWTCVQDSRLTLNPYSLVVLPPLVHEAHGSLILFHRIC
jgi:hypothetical protein